MHQMQNGLFRIPNQPGHFNKNTIVLAPDQEVQMWGL